MPASDFADKIISEMNSAIGQDGSKFDTNTPDKANKAIAKAITDYLTKNTNFIVAYLGTIPSPTGVITDPVVADVFPITGECEAPGTADNFSAWITDLSSKIMSGFNFDSGKVLAMVAPTPCFTPPNPLTPTYINPEALKTFSGDSIQKDVWTYICTGIIAWLNTIPPTPNAGYNTGVAGSTGVATTKIVLT